MKSILHPAQSGKRPGRAKYADRRAESRLTALREAVIGCRKCPRLVRYREKVARIKRRAYRDCTYWGRPVPGFGDPRAELLIIGLAPGAHAANRTHPLFSFHRS